MEQYIPLFIAFVGGGSLPLLVQAILTRRKTGTDLNIDRDGEIMKWLDKALAAADDLITAKYKLHAVTVELQKCQERSKKCKCPAGRA